MNFRRILATLLLLLVLAAVYNEQHVSIAANSTSTIGKIQKANNGKQEAIDKNGNVLIPPEYDMIHVAERDNITYYVAKIIKSNPKKMGVIIYDAYGNALSEYVESTYEYNDFIPGESIDFRSSDWMYYTSFDFKGNSRLPEGYFSCSSEPGNKIIAVKKSGSQFVRDLILPNGNKIRLEDKEIVKRISSESAFTGNFTVTTTDPTTNPLINVSRNNNSLKLYDKNGNTLGNYESISYEKRPDGSGKGFVFASYISTTKKADKKGYVGNRYITLISDDGVVYNRFGDYDSCVYLEDGLLLSYSYQFKTKNGDQIVRDSYYYDYQLKKKFNKIILDSTRGNDAQAEYYRNTNSYPFNQVLFIYREVSSDPFKTGTYKSNEGLMDKNGKVVLAATRGYAFPIKYNLIQYSYAKTNSKGLVDSYNGVYDVVKNKVFLEPRIGNISILEKEVRVYPLISNGKPSVVKAHSYGIKTATSTTNSTSGNVYYPTMPKTKIKLQNDPIFKRMVEVSESRKQGGLDNNRAWLGEYKSFDSADVSITFNGDNTATIVLKSYGSGPSNWLRKVLSESFGVEVAFPLVDMIHNDLSRTRLNNKTVYYTEQLDGMTKKAGVFDLTYKDSASSFSIKISYPKDVSAQGNKYYNNQLSSKGYKDISAKQNSLTQVMQNIALGNISDQKSTQDGFKNEFANQLNAEYDGNSQISYDIPQTINEIRFEGKSATSPVYGYYTFDRNSSYFKFYKLNDDFSAIKYLLKNRYDQYGVELAERIQNDYEMARTEAHSIAVDTVLYTLKGREYSVGPFMLIYDGVGIRIGHRYPVFDAFSKSTASDLNTFDFKKSVFNTGLSTTHSEAYYYNFFKKYGDVSNDWNSGKVRLMNNEIKYSINSNSKDMTLDFRNDTEYGYIDITYHPNNFDFNTNPYLQDYLYDCLTLSFGKKRADDVFKLFKSWYVDRNKEKGAFIVGDLICENIHDNSVLEVIRVFYPTKKTAKENYLKFMGLKAENARLKTTK